MELNYEFPFFFLSYEFFNIVDGISKKDPSDTEG